ncbi:MAG: response regulator [Patescibacteria group bacterium]|nr:response regulator [Patescibacteria group bacterium]
MKTILLIEDDPFLIDTYTLKLKEAGFSVEVATDGKQGLKKLAEKKFDLLILDIVLPQIDGWEILEKIKDLRFKIKELENLKIMVLSNLGQKEEVEKGIRLGAAKYLIKAYYTPSEVVEEIKKILTNDDNR